MKKPAVMLALGALLVGAFFFVSRRAGAATLNGNGGAAGDASGATGMLGPLVDQLFPGGRSTPLAFEGTGGTRTKPGTAPAPRTPIGTAGPFAPRPLGPGRIPPRQPSAPRRAPRILPRPRQVGAIERLPMQKGGVRRALN